MLPAYSSSRSDVCSSPPPPPSPAVDLLVLGGGWTFTFLRPLLKERGVKYAWTTRDGRDDSIEWSFDSEQRQHDVERKSGQDHDNDDDNGHFDKLPEAKTVLIVFPLKGEGLSEKLVKGYERAHPNLKRDNIRWIQLGSTGIFDGGPTLQNSGEKQSLTSVKPFEWTDRHSPYNVDNARAIAEDELLRLRREAVVLNLCGLWGGSRDPANWFKRVAPSKEALAAKGSVHFVHGQDVARAVLAVHSAPPHYQEPGVRAQTDSGSDVNAQDKGRSHHLLGRRYIVTDLRVYDWWDLASAWAHESAADSACAEAATWVRELMDEHGVRALPRSPEQIGRAMDSREFWKDFDLVPVRGRWERARA